MGSRSAFIDAVDDARHVIKGYMGDGGAIFVDFGRPILQKHRLAVCYISIS